MTKNPWKSTYKIAKLNFYLVLIGSPIIFACLFLYMHSRPRLWNNMEYLILLFIPAEIAMAFYIMKPAMEEAKYRFSRMYAMLSVDWISSCVQDALNDAKIPFTVSKNITKRVIPRIYYDVLYETTRDGFEIGITKIPTTKTVWVGLKYKESASLESIQRIRENIDERVTKPLIK